MNILNMGREQILMLDPEQVKHLLTPREFVHIARVLGAFWSYDYRAAEQGRPGKHALLKSGLHSDGFFVSKILLEYENICRIMAGQIVMRLKRCGLPKVDFVAGIPDGATKLGRTVAKILDVPVAKMKKVDGRIALETELPDRAVLLLIEDFCTRATGFTETCATVLEHNSTIRIVPIDPVMLNRGGLVSVEILGVGEVKILAVVNHRVNDWEVDDCELCKMGSEPIKPKAEPGNWEQLIASQLTA